MHTYKSSAMLKTMAKGQLLGKYPTAAAAFLSVASIMIVLRMVSSLLVDQSTLAGLIISYIVSFIISLLLGVINAGVLFMSLKISCNEPISVNDIFYGFSYQPDKVVLIQAVLSGVSLISTLPAAIFQSIFYRTQNYSYFLLTVIFYIVGIAVYCYVSLILSQAIFLLLDFSDRSAKELMRMSFILMKGQMGRLFYIWISFIPLLLLSVFTCCIGYIWVIPYIHVTMANFYMDLTQNRPQS